MSLTVDAAPTCRPRRARSAPRCAGAPARDRATTGTCCSTARATPCRSAPTARASIRGGTLLLDGVVVEDVAVEPVPRPRFYDLHDRRRRSLRAARPAARRRRARHDGRADVHPLRRRRDRCRFCAIEESLDAGATTRSRRRPSSPRSPRRRSGLDGVDADGHDDRHVAHGRDRGASHLARCVRGGQRGGAGPADPGADRAARRPRRGSTSCATPAPTRIGIHVESLDEDVRRRWTPGKATVPLADYRRGLAPRRSACSAATRCRPTCSSASARTPTSSSPGAPS